MPPANLHLPFPGGHLHNMAPNGAGRGVPGNLHGTPLPLHPHMAGPPGHHPRPGTPLGAGPVCTSLAWLGVGSSNLQLLMVPKYMQLQSGLLNASKGRHLAVGCYW